MAVTYAWESAELLSQWLPLLLLLKSHSHEHKTFYPQPSTLGVYFMRVGEEWSVTCCFRPFFHIVVHPNSLSTLAHQC